MDLRELSGDFSLFGISLRRHRTPCRPHNSHGTGCRVCKGMVVSGNMGTGNPQQIRHMADLTLFFSRLLSKRRRQPIRNPTISSVHLLASWMVFSSFLSSRQILYQECCFRIFSPGCEMGIGGLLQKTSNTDRAEDSACKFVNSSA